MSYIQQKEVNMPNAKKVKEILAERKMTQADLARASGIDPSNISHILKSNRNIREKTLWRLCKGLRCSPEEIILED